jgi:membrane protease YdiL (CAAX protease family)
MAGSQRHSPAARFAGKLALQMTVRALLSSIYAAGEEIGWRGYMLTRLIDAGIRRPVLASGIVWGVWHVPLILTGQIRLEREACAFRRALCCRHRRIRHLIARLRLESGSVWPAVLIHGTWNAMIQGVFDASTTGSTLLLGESGILVVAVDILFVMLLCRGTWQARYAPRDLPAPIAPLAV